MSMAQSLKGVLFVLTSSLGIVRAFINLFVRYRTMKKAYVVKIQYDDYGAQASIAKYAETGCPTVYTIPVNMENANRAIIAMLKILESLEGIEED